MTRPSVLPMPAIPARTPPVPACMRYRRVSNMSPSTTAPVRSSRPRPSIMRSTCLWATARSTASCAASPRSTRSRSSTATISSRRRRASSTGPRRRRRSSCRSMRDTISFLPFQNNSFCQSFNSPYAALTVRMRRTLSSMRASVSVPSSTAAFNPSNASCKSSGISTMSQPAAIAATAASAEV